jgi:hypothetical protein
LLIKNKKRIGKDNISINKSAAQPSGFTNPAAVVSSDHYFIQREHLCVCDGGCPRCRDLDTAGFSENMTNNGRPLAAAERGYFEPRFGADFDTVRIHTDKKADQAAGSIVAKAFTAGEDIYFADRQYEPGTTRGKHVLAHELTHVIQQSNHKNVIQRYPAKTPHGRVYTPGIMHNHRPSGNWAKIKRDSKFICALVPLDLISCACAFNSPLGVLKTARSSYPLKGNPLAIKHLDHYISGGGKDYKENVSNFLNRDQGVRYKLSTYIARSGLGHLRVEQSDYTDQDFRYAFGAIDRLDYEVDTAGGVVHVWFADRYEYHPVYPYYKKKPGDVSRITNCVHAAAVEAKLSGAADFWMYGYGTISLSSVKSTKRPMGGSGGIKI